MRTASLIIFLLFTAIANASAGWDAITQTYQSTGYVDSGSLQKRGDIASMRILIDYRKPPFDGNNLSYRSLVLRAEYNCASRQFRTMKLTSYRGNMATGHKPYDSDEAGEWQTVSASSIQHDFWKTACANASGKPAAAPAAGSGKTGKN